MEQLQQFIFPAVMLFAAGLLGAMFKRNLVVVFMSIELMLIGATLAFAAFASAYGNIDGAVFAFFVLTIGAAEVAVGLAVLTRLFKIENTVSTKEMRTLGD